MFVGGSNEFSSAAWDVAIGMLDFWEPLSHCYASMGFVLRAIQDFCGWANNRATLGYAGCKRSRLCGVGNRRKAGSGTSGFRDR